MIQFVFESTGKVLPEWEHEEERLVFRLSPAQVSTSVLLHGRIASREVDATVTDDDALGLVIMKYEGELAHQVRVILELPDDVWDALADEADALLEKDV
jgi:hypothetical protein